MEREFLVSRYGLWWALYVMIWNVNSSYHVMRNVEEESTLCITWKREGLSRCAENMWIRFVSARLLTYCLLKNACLIKTPPCLIWRLCHIKHWWHYVCNTTMFVCLCVTWVWNMYKLCITVWRINHALQEVGIILLTERIMIVEKSNQAYIAHWQLLDLTWISILFFRASHLLICCFQSRT